MIKTRTILGLVVIGLVFSFGLTSFAKKTPDGQTPAEETICDGAPQFGLCNAYCEAQDCSLIDPTNSCDQLLSNYTKQTGYPGPICVCRAVCVQDFEICIGDCPTRDDCRAAREECNAGCNGDQGCIADCTAKGQACLAEVDSCPVDCRTMGTECRTSCVEQECIQGVWPPDSPLCADGVR